MTRYILVVRNDGFDPTRYTAEKMEDIFKSVENWIIALNKDNILVDTAPLIAASAKTIKSKDKGLVVTGPYTEGAEIISGFYIIQADSHARAVEISKACPQLSIGCTVEVTELGRLRHGCLGLG